MDEKQKKNPWSALSLTTTIQAPPTTKGGAFF